MSEMKKRFKTYHINDDSLMKEQNLLNKSQLHKPQSLNLKDPNHKQQRKVSILEHIKMIEKLLDIKKRILVEYI